MLLKIPRTALEACVLCYGAVKGFPGPGPLPHGLQMTPAVVRMKQPYLLLLRHSAYMAWAGMHDVYTLYLEAYTAIYRLPAEQKPRGCQWELQRRARREKKR